MPYRRKRSNPSTKYPLLVIIIVVVILFASWAVTGEKPEMLTWLEYELFGESFGEDEALSIAFFDVGQGDCTLIGSNGVHILVDAGDNGRGPDIAKQLQSMGVRELDVVIGTHPDCDHIGGLDYVISNMKVNDIYMPNLAKDTKTYHDVLDAVETSGLKISIPNVSDTLLLGGMTLTFLHPPAEASFDEDNNYSIVVMIENSFGSVLLTGDTESEIENMMLNNGLVQSVDILKVGHHGSSSSTSEAFLETVAPQIAVISCSEGNDYGHPHREVLDLLEQYDVDFYRTDQDGTVRFTMDENGLQSLIQR